MSLKRCERAFSSIFGSDVVEATDSSLTVFLSEPRDRELALALAGVLKLTEPKYEIASDAQIRFVEVSYDEDEDADDEDTDVEPEDEFSGLVPESTEVNVDDDFEDTKATPTNDIDGNSRALKVLVDTDTHKMAQKLYTDLLNNYDMSTYPAFLMDFDSFLAAYYQEPEQEEGYELSSVLELAKGKGGARSAFLSAFMTALSGESGTKAIAAFEAKDKEALAAAISEVVDSLL